MVVAQGNTQTTASFKGTLLKRQRVTDSDIVQLVFREGDKSWLCVSTNPADAAWPVGGLYKIEGQFKKTGKRPYIYQPTIATLKQKRSFKLRLTFGRILVVVVLLTVFASALGVYVLLRPSHTSGQVEGASVTSPSQSPANSSATSSPAATQPVTKQPTTPASTTATQSKATATPAASTQQPAASTTNTGQSQQPASTDPASTSNPTTNSGAGTTTPDPSAPTDPTDTTPTQPATGDPASNPAQ